MTQDVTDISSSAQLVSFATAGQLAQVLIYRGDLSQNKVAYAAGLAGRPIDAGSVLSRALRGRLAGTQLLKLDETIGAITPRLDYTGSLSSLAERLSAVRFGHRSGQAYVPVRWTSEILKDPSPPSELGVLIQAFALLSAFEAAGRIDASGRGNAEIRDRYADELAHLVPRLIAISIGPPAPRSAEAQLVLGALTSCAFQPIKQRLDRELRSSPLGCRLWPAITWLVKFIPETNMFADSVRSWVRRLLLDAEKLRETSLYPGDGFDLELAMAVPAAWSPPQDDWVGRALLTRAQNTKASVRERGAAALALWERALRDERRGLEPELGRLIAEFRNPETRPDVAAGLRWVAATLDANMEKKVPVCNEWPDVDEPWFRYVDDAAHELDSSEIPEHLQPGAKTLFQHAILQNASIYRRAAIDTIATSGWNEAVVNALGRLLRSETEESWLRIRALAALGSLRRADYSVEDDLVAACLHAHANLKLAPGEPPRVHVSEMHATLFALGDCFSTDIDRAGSAREELRDVLIDLATVDASGASTARRATRAAAYFLTIAAQPIKGGERDFSYELLEQLSAYPDPLTSQLSKWALRFRFADDGSVRPMLTSFDEQTASAMRFT